MAVVNILKYGLIFSIIFLGSACFERDPNLALAPVSSGSANERPFYVVKKGDTLFSIAWQFDKDYKQLAYYNHISEHAKLQPGQRLNLISSRQLKPGPKVIKAKKSITPLPKNTTKPRRKPIRYSKYWYWPAKGRLLNKFSLVKHQKGIDIMGNVGSPVVASQAGVVAYSGNGLRGYGNLVILRHARNYLSAYAFNRKIFVKEGQQVKAKQKIAEMGKRSSGKGILHFEIRLRGKPVNPLNYLLRH